MGQIEFHRDERMRTNMARSFILSLFFLLLVPGCHLGDHGVVSIVSFNLAPTAGQTRVTLSVNDSQVQEALGVIDGVLVSKGLQQIPTPPAGHSDGAIRHYKGPPTRGCNISIRDQRLLVVFLEFGERQSSEPVKRICSSLKEELDRRYGSQRVRIETRF